MRQKVEVTNDLFFAPPFVPDSKQSGLSSLFREHVPFQTGLQRALLNQHKYQQSFRIRKQHKWSQMPMFSSTELLPSAELAFFITVL